MPKGLSARSLQLKKLKDTIAGGRALYNSYLSLIDETVKSDAELNSLREQAIKAATLVSDGLNALLERQYEHAGAEIAAAASADVLRERLGKLMVLNKVRQRFLLTQVADYHSQAQRQADLLRESLSDYGKITGEIDQLSPLMKKAEDIKALVEIKRQVEEYKSVLTLQLAASERSTEIGTRRAITAEAFQAFSSDLTEAAQSSASSMSHEGTLSLSSAATVTVSALIAALIVGTLVALVVTRMIAGPIVRATASVQKVATGDLSETIEVSSQDEVGQICTALNKLIEGLRGSAALAQKSLKVT